MSQEKRTIPIKILLSESEALVAHQQALAQDRAVADVVRSGWLLSTFGSFGLAQRRANKTRGDSSELSAEDFLPSGFGDMETGQAR